MPRIAFIHNHFPAGGAERVTIDIARFLKDFDGYEVFVYAHHCNPNTFNQYVTLRKIPSQAIQSRRSRTIENLIIKDKIDILVQVGKSMYDIEGIRKRTGIKVVLACHGEVFWQRHAIMYRRQRHTLLWKLLYRKLYSDGTRALNMAKARSWHDYNTCDIYTVLCNGYKTSFEAEFGITASESKIRAIENCERPTSNINYNKQKVALFCGRLENWSKRIDSLLRIWRKVEGDLPDWTLKIVGGGKDAAMLAKYARSLKLERVEFIGATTNPAQYYNEASLLLSTSYSEGFGLTTTEAMAHGCICIAFACSAGVKCIFDNGQLRDLCIEPGNEDAFASKLLEIASMPDGQQLSLRQLCVENIARFAPEIIMNKWKELFDTLIDTDEK